ncbi:hypothetical protein IE81DRAFT_367980 [Ceraceosorus guamensis]|uniref:Uncharacterized protein n=1 Tax=Ceraceosorus guamensis TaxID=1522189 RepID=A0A316VU92_9BASI|nr:hypothetical protein IE81DRAFT_367980 [Ceraceosorus guamensis]PWN40804.1 hypothetical protein IE81DRAFT_367980 [Ceraceosorus guamensis]
MTRPASLGKALKKLCCTRDGAEDAGSAPLASPPLNIPEGLYKVFHKDMTEYVDPMKDREQYYGGYTDPNRRHDPAIVPSDEWERVVDHDSLYEGKSRHTNKKAFWAFPGSRWQVEPDGALHQLEGDGKLKQVKAELKDLKYDAVHKGQVVGRFELPKDPAGGPTMLRKGVYDIEENPVQEMGILYRPTWDQASKTMIQMRRKQAAQELEELRQSSARFAASSSNQRAIEQLTALKQTLARHPLPSSSSQAPQQLIDTRPGSARYASSTSRDPASRPAGILRQSSARYGSSSSKDLAKP